MPISKEIEAALKAHQPATKGIVEKLADLLPESDILDILNDPGTEWKPARVYEALYRQLHRLGYSVVEIHTILRDRKVYRPTPGIIPVNDPQMLQGLAVELVTELQLGRSGFPNPLDASAPLLPKGTGGKIDFTLIPFRSERVSVTSLGALPVVLTYNGELFPSLVYWDDVDTQLEPSI